RVEAHVLQVVVLAARADALLGVRRPRVHAGPGARPRRQVGGALAQEYRDDRVPALGEEVQEGLADVQGFHRALMTASAIWRVPTLAPPNAMSAVRAPPVTAFLTAASILRAA